MMLVLKKRDLQFAMWFVLSVYAAAFVFAIFQDRSKVPAIVMGAAFFYALVKLAKRADKRKNAGG